MIYAVNKRTKEHRVVPRLDVYSNHDWRYVEADDDGWIEWQGGECPLPEGAQCEYKMRLAVRAKTVRGSEYLDWSHEGGSAEIVAYRPILNADEQAKPEAAEWDGEGLPPVGCECEYLFSEANQWRAGTCVAHHKEQAVMVDGEDQGAECCIEQRVHPLHSEEDKALEEMLGGKVVSSDEVMKQSVAMGLRMGKQARYQDAHGDDWIDEFARTATPEEFRGAMRFTVGKYLRRVGKKDAELSEVRKMRDYCQRWEAYLMAQGGEQ